MTDDDLASWESVSTDRSSGRDLVGLLAPEPARVLNAMWATSPVDVAVTARIRQTCADTLGLVGLPVDDTGRSDDVDPTIIEMARQFATDVSVVDDDLRARVGQACGRSTFETVQAVFVADLVPRVRVALDALAGAESTWDTAPPTQVEPPQFWATIEEFLREVHRLGALDPVVSEVVRLHGARQHNCRLCRSIRSRPALAAGADERLFDAIDNDGWIGLPERTRAALALTDAMIWHPASISDSLVVDVRRYFTPAEAVELVLDVMHNAANKIAVALAADAPNVTEGTEIYEIDADGVAHYGLGMLDR